MAVRLCQEEFLLFTGYILARIITPPPHQNGAYRDFRGSNFGINTAYEVDTKFNYDDWNCMIGGARFGEGDLDEEGTKPQLLVFRTYRNAGTHTWWAHVDIVSHINDEDHQVGVVCFRTGISQLTSWFQ